MIVPLFQNLKDHLSPNPNDSYIIREMKSKMLTKLNSRYTTDQFKCLKTCTLLDVRYKNHDYVKKDFHQLENGIKELLSKQEQQSQHEIPATEGQELENLSSIGRKARSNNNDSIFDYEDDDAVDEPIEQWDALEYELRNYKNVKMSATQKRNTNVLNWWKENQKSYPNLFKLAKAYLHIPATSVPSERIFSLAGYIVCDRRSRILADNVNKAIFLKRNAKHIPPETSIWSPST